DIWGSAPNDVFAVGDNGTILHFDGSTWARMSSGTSTALTRVWGASATEVYATTGSAILHYDGSGWSPLTPPPPPPRGAVTVASTSAAIAVYETNSVTTNDTLYVWNGDSWSVAATAIYLGVTFLGPDGRGAVGNRTIYPGLANDGTGWMASSQFGYRAMAIIGKSFDDLFVQKSGLGTCCQLFHGGWQTPMGSAIAWYQPLWYVSNAEVYLRNNGHVYRISSPLATSGTDEGIDAVAMWGSSSVDLFAVGADGKIYHRAH
ncbi:MAG TPA: hypothetical protein VJU82_13870, partial [Acidobacteriaceae bacterium]|nr:hypothetical protein [Acidobacteriaceae bacterium]